MTSSTFEELWGKLENARKSYSILVEQSETGEKPITSQSNRLNVLKGNLEEILQKAEDDLFDQWEYDEIISTGIALLNTINSALCSVQDIKEGYDGK